MSGEKQIKKILFYLLKIKDVLFKPQKCANPIYVQLEATTYCNLTCKMCIRNEQIKNPKHLSFLDFKKIYDQINPLKLTLSGQGEPTLNPELPEMIKYARSKETSVMIPTNGTMLAKKNIAETIVSSGLNIMKISIDAATSDTFVKVRGQDCFKGIIEGIKKVNEIKKQTGSLLPEIRFDVVLLKDNIREVPDIIKLAKSLDVNTVYFRALQADGLGKEREEELSFGIDFEDMEDYLRQAFSLAEELLVHTNLEDILVNFKTYKSIYMVRDAKMDNAVCLLPFIQCFISVDGDLAPCCALACNEKWTAGNVFSCGFSEVWNNKKMQQIRKAFREKKNPFGICKDCVPRSFSVLLSMSRMLPGFIHTKKKKIK